MRGIDIKAILLATTCVIGIDIVSGMLLFRVFTDLPLNASDAEVQAAAAALEKDSSYLGTALVLGTASTVLGGYLVARIARAIPYFNALAFAVISIVLGLMLSMDLPLLLMVVGFGLTIPAALFGAYLGNRRALR
ncbi:MAG: hypothetical protein ABW034_21565 [Steroidobacteraceae bacterium]